MLTKILKRFGVKKFFALVLLIFKLKKHSIITWHIFSPWHRPSEHRLCSSGLSRTLVYRRASFEESIEERSIASHSSTLPMAVSSSEQVFM